MLLLKDECALCKRVFSSSHLRRCTRCGKLYCFDCSTFDPDGYFICLNCARRAVSPRKFGTKYSSLSRFLLRRGMFTDRAVLSFGEIEGIIGDNLPLTATRDSQWWTNSRSTAQGRSWIDIGWNVEIVDMDNRKITLVRVAKPQTGPEKRTRMTKKVETYRSPLKHVRTKKPLFPSRTRIAQVQARLKNIERRKSAGYQNKKPAYEKRLFKPGAKPSKGSD